MRLSSIALVLISASIVSFGFLSPGSYELLSIEGKPVKLKIEGIETETVKRFLPKEKPYLWWLVNLQSVESQLLRSPHVSNASLKPCAGEPVGCLHLKVESRELAFRFHQAGRELVISSDGTAVRPVLLGRPADMALPSVRFAPSVNKYSRSEFNSQLRKLARNVLAFSRSGLRPKRVEVGADWNEVLLIPRARTGVPVKLRLASEPEELASRVASALSAAESRDGRLREVDARNPSRVVLSFFEEQR